MLKFSKYIKLYFNVKFLTFAFKNFNIFKLVNQHKFYNNSIEFCFNILLFIKLKYMLDF